MAKFVCFIKYYEHKFDIVLGYNLPEEKNVKFTTFNDIVGKMIQVFRVALKKNMDIRRHLFELTDSTVVKPSLIISGYQRIRHLSVITVRHRPLSLSDRHLVTKDDDLKFLKSQTNEIIAFYLIVDSIASHYLTTSFLGTDSDSKWQSVFSRLLWKYPNIFRDYSSNKCRQVFTSASRFYINNYHKLNLKLEAALQKKLDMLKIIHLLIADMHFSSYFGQQLLRIGDSQEIKDYCYLQMVHIFDMYLNTNRVFKERITYEEFAAKYISEPTTLCPIYRRSQLVRR